MLALVGLAGVAALISNGLAGPARRLAWTGSVAILPNLQPRIEALAPSISPPPLPSSPEAKPVPAPPSAPKAAPVKPSTPPKIQTMKASDPIREISGEEAWKLYQAGVPFLDARRSADFTEGHIQGAWCTPVWESDLDDRLIFFKAGRRPAAEDPMVIYCSGGDCRDSHLLAAKLLNEGYFQLLIFRDGFPAWVTQGHPTAKGQS
jgi:rhodanese-related sulfurtransferase